MMVSRPLHLMVAAVLASTSSGRGALILAHQDSVGLDGPVSTNVTLGSPRETVEAPLGKPATSRLLPDGSRVDTYVYTERNPEWRKQKLTFALVSLMTVGFAEPILVPWAGYEPLVGAERSGVSSDSSLPVPRPYAYSECLVRRLAIWGIE